MRGRQNPTIGAGVGVLLVAAIVSQAWSETATWILPLLALIGWALAWTDGLRLDRGPDALDVAVVLWLSLWVMSATRALDPAHAFALSVPTLVFVLLFVLCRRGDARIRRRVVDALALLAGLQALDLLLAIPFDTVPAARVLAAASPWVLVPNDAAWWLCLWPLWWQRVQETAPPRRWLWAASMFAQILALAMLQSRLACVLLALVCIVLWRGGQWRRSAALGGAALALTAVAILIITIGKGVASVQARLQLWQAAWTVWRSHPWLGVGPHGFGPAYRDVDVGPWVDPRQTPWPHQLLLELMANTGLLGTLAFLLVAMLAIRGLRGNAGGASRARVAALLSFATISLLEASPLRMWWWVVLAVLLGGTRSDQARTSG
jgi:O-antigen ligase